MPVRRSPAERPLSGNASKWADGWNRGCQQAGNGCDRPELHCFSALLVPCWDVAGGEDVFGSGGRGSAAVRWWPLRLMVTSWRGFEGADDAFDADPGGVLEAAGYGQGGLIQDGVAGVDGGQNTCP